MVDKAYMPATQIVEDLPNTRNADAAHVGILLHASVKASILFLYSSSRSFSL